MAFVRKQGKTKIMWLPVTTSTTFTKGDLTAWSSGLLIKATTTTAPSTHVGVITKTIAATDSDYATARLVPIEVPVELNVVWEFPTASLVAADIGLFCDLTDAGTVNRGGSTYDAVQVTQVISTTKGRGILNLGIGGMGVVGG